MSPSALLSPCACAVGVSVGVSVAVGVTVGVAVAVLLGVAVGVRVAVVMLTVPFCVAAITDDPAKVTSLRRGTVQIEAQRRYPVASTHRAERGQSLGLKLPEGKLEEGTCGEV